MWVRKTTEEIVALRRNDRGYRLNPFVPIVIAALFTGFSILKVAISPGVAAFLFFTIFLLACNVQAQVHDLFLNDIKSRVDRLAPATEFFCPECRLLRSHLALCPDCRGPLEPMAHWKWVEAPNWRPPVAPEASIPPATATSTTETSILTRTREIRIAVPIARRKLAAKLGITHSRLLKDLADENLFATVSPRLADREVLALLGRKYGVAIRSAA